MLVPVLAVLAVPNAQLGASAAERRAVDPSAAARLAASNDNLGPGLSYAYIMAAQDRPQPGVQPGTPVRLVGFVIRRPGTPDTMFQIARFFITCCVADATVLYATVDPPAEAPPRNTWLDLSGTLARRNGQLIVQAEQLHKIAPPQHPYLSASGAATALPPVRRRHRTTRPQDRQATGSLPCTKATSHNTHTPSPQHRERRDHGHRLKGRVREDRDALLHLRHQPQRRNAHDPREPCPHQRQVESRLGKRHLHNDNQHAQLPAATSSSARQDHHHRRHHLPQDEPASPASCLHRMPLRERRHRQERQHRTRARLASHWHTGGVKRLPSRRASARGAGPPNRGGIDVTPDITLRVYSHLLDDGMERAADAFDPAAGIVSGAAG